MSCFGLLLKLRAMLEGKYFSNITVMCNKTFFALGAICKVYFKFYNAFKFLFLNNYLFYFYCGGLIAFLSKNPT